MVVVMVIGGMGAEAVVFTANQTPAKPWPSVSPAALSLT